MEEFEGLHQRVVTIAARFAAQRHARQLRTQLDPADFRTLADAGMTRIGVPLASGGLWQSVRQSVRPISGLLRALAAGDSSVALVSAMHPAVLSYWLTENDSDNDQRWRQQCERIFGEVLDGAWWGTITSEPGSGGDVARTRMQAEPTNADLKYHLTGDKHFGSGSGVMSFMVTSAIPTGESQADWFYLDVRDVAWDGSQGMRLVAPWDGHGMTATQSHAFRFEQFPATRVARSGLLPKTSLRTGGFIGCLFTAVVVGIVDEAVKTASEKFAGGVSGAYEQVEWTRVGMEHWLIRQAFEGMLRAVESQDDPRHEVLQGKTAIAELSEQLLTRLCRALGGGTFSRRSPFGFWFEDVRALGFLRPPWALAMQTLADG
jgi:alkylation response protein AidB-like acyl-CoA dehydrogenase